MQLNLIQDLLDLAKQENLTFTFNKGLFSLIQNIDMAFKTLLFISQTKRIETKVEFDNNDSDFLNNIVGDENRFQQIFLNFLSNSMKFTNSGGKVTVAIKVKKITKFGQNSDIIAEEPLVPDARPSSSSLELIPYNEKVKIETSDSGLM